MICPLCKTQNSKMEEIETDLCATRCKECGGHWLVHNHYLRWIDKQPKRLPEKPLTDFSLQSRDDSAAKMCPDCDKLLLRYKVGHDLDFSVEHCGRCGGIWLDGNEWDILKEKNLHDDIHKIFSTPWQNRVRDEKLRKREAEGKQKNQQRREQEHHASKDKYKDRFGPEAFEKAEAFRAWLKEQQHPNEILRFVSQDNPFFK